MFINVKVNTDLLLCYNFDDSIALNLNVQSLFPSKTSLIMKPCNTVIWVIKIVNHAICFSKVSYIALTGKQLCSDSEASFV